MRLPQEFVPGPQAVRLDVHGRERIGRQQFHHRTGFERAQGRAQGQHRLGAGTAPRVDLGLRVFGMIGWHAGMVAARTGPGGP